MSRIPTVLRTLRRIRPAQALAQIHHMLFGLPRPRRLEVPAPALAVTRVSAAFLAPPAHVRAEEGEHGLAIELLARRSTLSAAEIDWNDDEYGPLFAYHLHEHAYLRHDGVSPATRERVIRDWIVGHPEGVGWDPHPISLRLLSWSKLLLTPGALPDDVDFRETMLRSMADQAETLAGALEVRLQANHLLSNLLGVVFAGLLVEEATYSNRWRAKADALVEELEAQVHRDGGHEERSPMYHSLILENVLDLMNLAQASSRAPTGFADALASVARRMVDALSVLTGPDGQIALFADSAWGVAAEPALLIDYARRLGVEALTDAPRSHRLRETGYARLVDGAFDLIVSLDGPRPTHQPGHAHCDALSFELFVGEQRLIADTGVFEYRAGTQRDQARATASHSTLTFGDHEQSEIWSAHRVGGRAYVGPVEFDSTGSVAAEVEGFRRGTPVHRRRFDLRDGILEIHDSVSSQDVAVASRLLFAPGWHVELSDQGDQTIARSESTGRRVEIALPADFVWTLESAPFFPTFHMVTERSMLVGRATGTVDAVIRFEMRDC